MVQDGLQEAFWMAFESILGGFGPLLDTLGDLWAFFWPSNLNFYKALVQHGLQVAFWIDFESILAGFGEDLDASW